MIAEQGQPIAVPPKNDRDLLAIGEWVRATCLMFGTSPSTAYHVAGHFVGGLERDLKLVDQRRT